MSTIEDFENAPIGATAQKEVGLVAIREGYETAYLPWLCTTYGEWLSNEELAERGYTLVPPAPTTAREALDLAWELAHPVKEGQVISSGTDYLSVAGGRVHTDRRICDYEIKHSDTALIRTLDPLSDPEPDWLDAPAVLAAMDECSRKKVWFPKTGGLWECTCCGAERHWSKMADVTPLYPKGQDR